MSGSRRSSVQRHVSKVAALLSILVGLVPSASAQTTQDFWTDLRPGTVVDMDLMNPTMKCTGTVTGRHVDTVAVSRVDPCRAGAISKADVRSFRVQYNEGSRSDHAGKGLLIGLATGAILGKLAGPKCLFEGPCDSGVVTPGLIAGAALGTIVGFVVGLGRDAGEQWRPIPIPSVIQLSDPRP